LHAPGRSRLIELTEDGRRLHQKADPLWRAAQRQFEHMNGVEKASALRTELRAMVVGDQATPPRED
jgi:DNA-binding MarR family transcriptional regulator